jgi:ornithine cyclodeaminase/alanine dehydrogenase-like protein (mu-crystallin family)
MKAAVESMRTAFVALWEGRATVPRRIQIDMREPAGMALFMPSAMSGALDIKTVTLFADNPAKGLPYLQGIYCLFDETQGSPVALLDGRALTAIRTGAASGLATELLARSDASKVAILGAGVQGRSQLRGVCAVRRIAEAAVFDPSRDRAERFKREMSEELGLAVSAAASSREAIRAADVVCAATVSETPVFDDADLPAGVHLNAIGSYKPHVQEIPVETVLRSKLVVDEKASALAETGDLIIPIRRGLMTEDHIHAELGELAAGRATGRGDRDEVTFFKSVGLAVQDLAAAQAALAGAKALGIGRRWNSEADSSPLHTRGGLHMYSTVAGGFGVRS